MAVHVYNPAVVKLVAEGHCEGQIMQNVTHWVRGAEVAWTPVAMGMLAGQYADAWNSNLQALTRADYVMSSITVTQQAADGFQIVSTVGLPQSGSATGDALPLNVAACITLAGERAGKAGRGRYFHGGLVEATTVGSRFTPAFVLAANTAFAAMTELVDEDGGGMFHLAVYSTMFNKVPRPAGLATKVHSAFLRDDIVDSQRRRLPGRGR
jgi:hypothetical protein